MLSPDEKQGLIEAVEDINGAAMDRLKALKTREPTRYDIEILAEGLAGLAAIVRELLNDNGRSDERQPATS